jgi:hypothetical protein
MTTTPVPRIRCTKATNAKAPTRHALRRGERNKGSPSPNRNLTSSLGTFWAMSFHDWPPSEGGGAPNPPPRSAGAPRCATLSPLSPVHRGAFPLPIANRRLATMARRDGPRDIGSQEPRPPAYPRGFLFARTIRELTQISTAEQFRKQRIQHSEEPIVLAQRGRCKAFGETNKCRPMWDNRGKSCVCAGA